ncbi:MAG: acyl-CoA thioesterase II [Actinomycetia bacterium]|nr:acyl-CoA thioesterase II [Actinomycetes bacterium]MCP4958468.1 acyl-CoA thioesterase II [Actinomycetes bacterium]
MTKLGTLALEHGDGDLFVGTSPASEWGRIYGGLVVAQALLAAGQTVPEGVHPHSLHAYFVRAGNSAEKIDYDVERVRDGRSFVTRAVHARQSNGNILMMIASFHRDEVGHDAQNVEMPIVPAPDTIERAGWMSDSDCREMAGDGSGHCSMWGRWDGAPLLSRLEHAAAVAYLSDAMPMDSIADTHPIKPAQGEWDKYFMSASLDHAIWFHGEIVADQWLLYESRSPGLRGHRGVCYGNVFTADGRLVASVAQEGLLREVDGSSE